MSKEKEASASPSPSNGVSSAIFEYIEMFVFAAVTVILLMTFALRLCVVSGPSMINKN